MEIAQQTYEQALKEKEVLEAKHTSTLGTICNSENPCRD
jgi:hypothetical protein